MQLKPICSETMNTITEWSLTYLTNYGFPVLLGLSFFGSLGIPFPISMVIMAAGALTRAGYLDWWMTLLACLTGAAIADNSEYLLGKLAQPWLRRKFETKTIWQEAQSSIHRQGGWAIFLTRFWLTPLAPAVNVLAGTHYPYLRFFTYDMTGQLLWVLLYCGLGYLFAAQWEWLSQAIGAFSWISVAVVGAVYAWLWIARRRTPQALHGERP